MTATPLPKGEFVVRDGNRKLRATLQLDAVPATAKAQELSEQLFKRLTGTDCAQPLPSFGHAIAAFARLKVPFHVSFEVAQ